MPKESKGVRLDHISKIYKDPKTGKDFYAVTRRFAGYSAGQLRDPAGSLWLRQDYHPAYDRRL